MAASKVFISYSTKNKKFVEKLEQALRNEGFEVLRDVHSLGGGPIQQQIEALIEEADALLLVFSNQAIGSDWVEWEVQCARANEKKKDKHIICPIALDKAWTKAKWPGPLMQQVRDYLVLDFSVAKKSQPDFDKEFAKLVKGLRDWY